MFLGVYTLIPAHVSVVLADSATEGNSETNSGGPTLIFIPQTTERD